LLKRLKTKNKGRSGGWEESSNSNSNYSYYLYQKLQDMIIFFIYSLTDKLHYQMSIVTALLELLTDCSIRASWSLMPRGRGRMCPLILPLMKAAKHNGNTKTCNSKNFWESLKIIWTHVWLKPTSYGELLM